MIRTLPSPNRGFHVLEQYLRHAWRESESVLRLQLFQSSNIRDPAVLLFEGSGGYRFAVLLQGINGRYYADIVWCWEGEHAVDVLGRCKKELEPQDRVNHRLSQEKVISVNIRKCPGGHVADISIHSDESPSEPKLD